MSEAFSTPAPASSQGEATPTPAPADGTTPASAPAPAPAATAADAPSEGEAADATPQPDAGDEPKPDAASEAAAGDSEPITPESYEFTLPEAFTKDATLEQAAREAFAAHGVPKDAAQPLVDLFTSTLQAQAQAAQAEFDRQQATWTSEINAMPEFKEGPTREKALASIGRLIDTYGDAGVKDALNMYGIGNNPALAKFMARVAAELDEGSPSASPRGPSPTDKNGKAVVKGQHLTYDNTPTQQ